MVFKSYYNKLVDKTTGVLTNIALEKFMKSNYLRDTTASIPLTILSISTRTIFHFLITSRLKTDIYILDFCFSLFVTVFFSIFSPFFYNLYHLTLEEEAQDFSVITLEGVWEEGWVYVELWKSRILGTLGILIIIILFFVEINSQMIQEFIFHTLLSSYIVDYLTNLSLKKKDKGPAAKIIESPKETLLNASNSYHNLKEYFENYDKPIIIEEYNPLKKRNKN